MKCKICGKECSNRGIGTHVRNQHKISPQEYYDKYIGKHYCPICRKETSFRSIHQGYLTYCSISCANLDNSVFIHNNPQKNPEIRKKTVKTNLEKYNVTNTFQIPEVKEKCTKLNHTKEALEKRSNSLFSNIKEFCKENNCITLEEALSINPCVGWFSDVTFIIYGKWRKMVSCDDIEFIKNYVSYSGKSKKEEELFRLIRDTYNNEVIHCDRKAISPYELDIYLPNKNLAIEYNGVFWHSIQNKSDKYHILNKSLLCKEKNIRLIHIFDIEDFEHQKKLLLDLILYDIDNYPKRDFNKNNFLNNIPQPEVIYSDNTITTYGAGKLY